MAEPLDHEYVATVFADHFDARDRAYPPTPLEGDDAFRRPRELFIDAIFAEEIEPRTSVGFDLYRGLAEPTRQQKGEECTGFALAAIADFHQRKDLSPDALRALPHDDRAALTASRRMLYEMAQLYDGVDFPEGSTLRGALRGWRQLGVSSDLLWPYDPDDEHGKKHGRLTMSRLTDAVARPGGFYYRIEPHEDDKIRDALARGFPLYASAELHTGWYRLFLPGDDHVIRREPRDKTKGGHAIVLVGYDENGLWIHNSWGDRWADGGFAQITWDDWARDGRGVWFVVPPPHPRRAAAPEIPEPPADPVGDLDEMWRHIVTVGDDGRLAASGPYKLDEPTVGTLLYMFAEHTDDWPTRRLAIFADGGYWATPTAIEQLRPLRDRMMEEHIYPIFLVWEQPWYSEVLEWLHGEEGLENLDPADLAGFWEQHGGTTMANVLAAMSVAPRAWGEVVDRSCHAGQRSDGAVRLLSESMEYKWGQAVDGKIEPFDIHLLAHGTGAYVLAELLKLLDMPIASCDLWAPAMVADDFGHTFGDRAARGQVRHVTIRGLDEESEGRDHFGPIPRSLLSVASDVLTIPGLDLTRAVAPTKRDGSPKWSVVPTPVVGMSDFFTAPAVADLASVGRLSTWTTTGSHTGLLVDPAVHEAAIDDLVRRSPGGIGPGKAPHGIVDPLERAIAEAQAATG